jgi:lipid-A-disaccharide synthase-like uncharacterized protein
MYDYIMKVLLTPFIRLDWWDAVGFVGQTVFFGRFIVQWIASEKKQRNVLPVAFWYLSIIGAFVTLLYYIHLGRLPLILAGLASMVIYGRNLRIWFNRRTKRRGLVFASAPAQTGYAPPDEEEPPIDPAEPSR